VTKQGVVDLAKPAVNREGVALEYVFLANEGESVIRADAAGLHAPRSAPWPPCAPDKPCRFSVPAPTCTFPAIRAAASAVGVGDDDRALVTYADGRAPNGSGTNGPEWTVTVAGRGAAHFDATTCKPVAGERLVPAALPLAEIPGAPKDVDPIALLPIAKARSGLEADAVLLEIDVRGMSSAGKVDLSAPDTGILYTFADPPRGAQRRWRVVEVGKYGIPVTSTSDDHLPLPTRLESGGIDAPACTLSFLFTTIGTMPADATAHVVYAPDSANPEAGALTVDVPGAGIHRTLTDAMCRAWEKLPQTPKPR